MPVKVITTELGHSVPPEEPHNITFHIPGWDTAKALRRGDPELLSKLSSIYPRFGPWCEVRQLANLIHAHLGLPPTHGTLLFTHPDTFATAQRFSASRFRKPEHRVPPEELLFRVVDIPLSEPESNPATTTTDPNNNNDSTSSSSESAIPIRLYVTAYPLARGPGAVGVWQNHGTGISSRLAAALLPAAGRGQISLAEGFPADGRDDVSVERVPRRAGGLPLGEAHAGLRERIAGLVGGGVGEGDVFLYPTGMAAIYRLHRAMEEVRGPGGKVVVLGSVFHNTFHLFEESEGGMKHFGRCDAGSRVMEALEEFLEGEGAAGRGVAYVFAEFPSNPILVSVDLRRLRELADKYDIPVVIDDTIGSFCNIDVTAVADVVVSSITKSLSGYANVMGGSIVLPPTSPHHAAIKSTLTARFHNEYFHADAAKLLSNSLDYHARSAILNRNALALATFLHNEHALSPSSPVTAVLYPPFTDTRANYESVMRPTPTPTPDFQPGYGCLLAVDFETLAAARAFYDALAVYHGPHLGAHQTLAFPFNDAIWGPDPAAAAYLASFGARPEQVRVSVGLETEGDLVDTFRAALAVAEEVKRKGEGAGEGEGTVL